ncbi:MAG: aspartate aminotransferase family protein [Cellvibrionales bacterium]|nr:aspartate aminotransferase family protein [Cellvibrionales bacterium]
MSGAFLMDTYGERELRLVRGAGCRVWDAAGRRYLDALMGIAVCGVGHAHPAITAVLAAQAGQLVHASNLYRTAPQEALAEKLCAVAGMERAFFGNSGAEANEAAIKLSRLYARERGIERPVVLVAEGGFHGRTLAALSATSSARARAGFAPLFDGFVRVPFDDLAALERYGDDPAVVAVMLEPVQGEGGIRIPAAGYLRGVRALCDRCGWLLILDEVQTGNGRTGTHFAQAGAGVCADILTTAKGLGNGVPIGACLARGVAAGLFGPGSHGSTYGGNPLVCAVAGKVFDLIESEGLAARAAELGEWLRVRLAAELAGCEAVREVRGCGLMLAIEMRRDCGELVRRAAAAGLLINVTAGCCVRLLPALNMSAAEAEELVGTLCPVILHWAADVAENGEGDS